MDGPEEREALFERLVARHKADIFRIALSVLGPGFAADAEDVTQDVLVKLHGSLSSFRGESRLSTWIYRVAFRAAVDRKRLARFRLPHDSEEECRSAATRATESPLEIVLGNERGRLLLRFVDRLPDAQRAVVRLHYWLDRDVSEIAALLDQPPGTVKSHLHRARERLRQLLKEGEHA